MRDKLIGSQCICYGIPYDDIIELVEKNEKILTVEDVQNHMVCCKRCKLCVPDIQVILQYYRNK